MNKNIKKINKNECHFLIRNGISHTHTIADVPRTIRRTSPGPIRPRLESHCTPTFLRHFSNSVPSNDDFPNEDPPTIARQSHSHSRNGNGISTNAHAPRNFERKREGLLFQTHRSLLFLGVGNRRGFFWATHPRISRNAQQ